MAAPPRSIEPARSAGAPIDNDEFFGGPPLDARGFPLPAWRRAFVPERAFFPTKRPPEERSFAQIGARRALVFGALLLGLGWLGILIQRGLLRQLVVGAPVFEEFAKFGLALVVVALLGIRKLWARVPFGWASGAGFGVFEHFVTYSSEDVWGIVFRVAFHGASTGLSVAIFTIIESDEDVRLRWGSTLTSSLLHWANNFGSVALGLALALLFVPDEIANGIVLGWSFAIIASTLLLTFVVLAAPDRAGQRARREARRLFAPRSLTAAPVEAPPAARPELAAPGPHDSAAPAEGPQERPPEPPRDPPGP